MGSSYSKRLARLKRQRRIRKTVTGSTDRPRLSVFRSARHIYAQLIDDKKGITIACASSVEKSFRALEKFESKTAQAVFIGKLIGERAKEKGINKVVFDRNGFLYHGRIKAVSEGAREAGLDF
ncbi:MAG: 50S ribosomal protein L18 [Pseudomonadota bacterium]